MGFSDGSFAFSGGPSRVAGGLPAFSGGPSCFAGGLSAFSGGRSRFAGGPPAFPSCSSLFADGSSILVSLYIFLVFSSHLSQVIPNKKDNRVGA